MEYAYYKYPKTFHVKWSENLQNDDRLLYSTSELVNRRIIVSEKLDGECFSLYKTYTHARSINSKDHPTRHWVKALHASVKHLIPRDWRICGENMFALHSIYYTELTSYFYVFAIFDEKNIEIPWDDTVKMCEDLGLQHVPVLYDGVWDLEKVGECYTGQSLFKGWQPKEGIKTFSDFRELILTGKPVEDFGDPTQEGYVIRVADSFHYDDFQTHTCKWVRKSHVRSSDHWMSEQIIKNKKKEALGVS